jgi:hypothetical protein
MRALTASSFSTLPSASANTAIGTPQARWRDSTQSGRSSIIERSRVWPAAGTKRVASMAASARVRRVSRACVALPPRGPVKPFSSLSIWTNHCGVLRKMIGFFERHECGYWCFSRHARTARCGRSAPSITRLVGVALLAIVVDDTRRPALAVRPKTRRVLGVEAGIVDR